MAYVCIDMFSFANEKVEKEFEAACAQWRLGERPAWPLDPYITFIGRLARDPLGKYTHAIIFQYDDFSAMKKTVEEYADTLETSSKPEGDFPGYMFEHWYGFRVVPFDDPILKEHGIKEWTRRELTDDPPVFKNPARAAKWQDAIATKLEKDWPKESLAESGWKVREMGAPAKK